MTTFSMNDKTEEGKIYTSKCLPQICLVDQDRKEGKWYYFYLHLCIVRTYPHSFLQYPSTYVRMELVVLRRYNSAIFSFPSPYFPIK